MTTYSAVRKPVLVTVAVISPACCSQPPMKKATPPPMAIGRKPRPRPLPSLLARLPDRQRQQGQRRDGAARGQEGERADVAHGRLLEHEREAPDDGRKQQGEIGMQAGHAAAFRLFAGRAQPRRGAGQFGVVLVCRPPLTDPNCFRNRSF